MNDNTPEIVDPFRPAIDHFKSLVKEGFPHGLAVAKAAELFGFTGSELSTEMTRRSRMRRLARTTARTIRLRFPTNHAIEIDQSRVDIYG